MNTEHFNQELLARKLYFPQGAIKVGDPVVIADLSNPIIHFNTAEFCILLSHAAVHTTTRLFNNYDGHLLTTTLGSKRTRSQRGGNRHFLDFDYKVLRHCPELLELIDEYRLSQFDLLLGLDPDD